MCCRIVSFFCCIIAQSALTSSFQSIIFCRKPLTREDKYFSWISSSRKIIHFPQNKGQSIQDWMKSKDEYFMGLAIQQAVEAAKKHEVPIGAILVRPDHQSEDASNPVTSFEVLSTSHNQVEYGIDAIAHAEILCFRAAAKTISNWRLVNTTLYTTLEPCITCMAAAYAFRIDRIVYGAQDFRLGAVTSWVNYDEVIPKHPYHPKGKITVTGGVREEECGKLLKDFFRAIRNQQQPSSIMRRDMSDSLLKQPNRQRMNGFSRIRTMIKTFIGRFFKG